MFPSTYLLPYSLPCVNAFFGNDVIIVVNDTTEDLFDTNYDTDNVRDNTEAVNKTTDETPETFFYCNIGSNTDLSCSKAASD